MQPQIVWAQEFEPYSFDLVEQDRRESVRGRIQSVAAMTLDPWLTRTPGTLSTYLQPGVGPSAHCMVGQVWLSDGGPKDIVLRVRPKVCQASAIRMYAACLSDDVVRAHLDSTITMYWDEEALPASDFDAELTPLIIGRYLSLLYTLCQKHLRSAVQPIEENLVGRVRGRPLMQQTTRRNLARGRPDRVFCRYQVQSQDTVDNQILMAALRQAIKYLSLHGIAVDGFARLTAFCLEALNGVTVRRILPTDFQGLRYGGFMRPYMEPHRWAKLILKRLGYDPHEETGDRQVALPPFAIDMNELFERYCEVLLRKGSNEKVWAGYDNNNLGTLIRLRPDFLIGEGESAFIVDAKYKLYWDADWDNKWIRNDIFQVVVYSRHRGIRNQMCGEGLCRGGLHMPRCVILYPSSHGRPWTYMNVESEWSKADVLRDAFEVEIGRIAIPLPGFS